MHEMSIAQALFEAVEHELAPYPDAEACTAHVRVGKLRLVEPLALEFCYRCLAEGSSMKSWALEIEEIPGRALCDNCSTEFTVDDTWFECPTCHALGARVVGGTELDLVSIDVEEA